jgi:hypothetical protein
MMKQEDSRPPWWFMPVVCSVMGIATLGLAGIAFKLAGCQGRRRDAAAPPPRPIIAKIVTQQRTRRHKPRE